MFHMAVSSMGRRAIAPFAAAALSSVALVSCEEQDPYDNLPDEDEPTPCSICRVNRQGPCRPLWRKFERCMKDNVRNDDEEERGEEKEENSSSAAVGIACDKYTMEWIDCIQPHRNLYMLLANEESQKEWIDPLETDLTDNMKVTPLPWKDADIDWSDLWGYADEKGWSLDDFGATRINWKAYLSGYFGQRDLDDYVADRDVKAPEVDIILGDSLKVKPIYDAETFQGDPEVIEVRVRINLEEPDGLVIDTCYARDQAGRVIGMEQPASKLEEGVKEAVLRVSVQPGTTNCIKLYKLYKGENGEMRFYASKPKFLVEAAFEAGRE